MTGTLTGATTSDRVHVVSGNVVGTGRRDPAGSSFTSLVSTIIMNSIEPDGGVVSYGSNADGQDWVATGYRRDRTARRRDTTRELESTGPRLDSPRLTSSRFPDRVASTWWVA